MRRKAASVVLATAIALSTGVVAAAPAGAAKVAGCQWVKGSGAFKPGLPKSGDKTKVKPTFSINPAGLGECSGGGVSRGTLVATLKAGVAGNCNTLNRFVDLKFTGTAKITWNTKATSRIATAKMTPVPHPQFKRMKLTGKVTAGKFVGKKLTSEFNITPAVGGCRTDGLTKVNIRQAHPLTIDS
jgi:hypothetical protein